MEILHRRDEYSGIDTPGTIFVDGVFECRSLEDPVREVPGRPTAYWKEDGRTAIPAGRYRVAMVKSPRFGPDTITLLDVPGFTEIRVHGGNDEDDTEGCPLVGLRLEREPSDGSWAIPGGASRPALQALQAKVKAALDAVEEVWWTVRNPPGWFEANGIAYPASLQG